RSLNSCLSAFPPSCLAEHFLRMFAERGRREADVGGRARQLDDRAKRRDIAELWMRLPHHQTARLHLRMFDRLAHRSNASERDVLLSQPPRQLVDGPRRELPLQLVLQRSPVRHTI